MAIKLTLGPLPYHWQAEKARDFYFRIADEAPVDRVYVGQTVCVKREPLQTWWPEITERLERAGKQVVRATLSLIASKLDLASAERAATNRRMMEISDPALLPKVAGGPFAVGPTVNVYHAGTRDYLEGLGAAIITLPPELRSASIRALTRGAKAEIEVLAYGRAPLAISVRCYHARTYGLHKDNCRFVCDRHPDGMPVDTLDGEPFLTVNGVQTQSRTYVNLLQEVPDLMAMNVSALRLSPQDTDMVAVAHHFRDVADGKNEPQKHLAALHALTPDIRFANGFFHAVAGNAFRPDHG